MKVRDIIRLLEKEGGAWCGPQAATDSVSIT